MDRGAGFRGHFKLHWTRKEVMEMNVRKQNGLTLIGFIIVLGIVLFFAYGGMRIIPMYLEYHALINAMDKLANDPMAKSMPAYKIKQSIQMSLWASYASNNIKNEHIRISKKSDGVNVRVAYEVREDFLGNIDLVGSFDRTVVLR
jgi:Tfp pilus assembly major pilin PilA